MALLRFLNHATTLHRLVRVLPVDRVASLALSSPQLFQAVVTAPERDLTADFYSGLCDLSLSQLLDTFHSLRALTIPFHLLVNRHSDEDQSAFFEACIARRIHISIVGAYLHCLKPLCAVASRLSCSLPALCSFAIEGPLRFRGHRFDNPDVQSLSIHVLDFATFFSANPWIATVTPCSTPSASLIDLDAGTDVDHTQVTVKKPTPLMVAALANDVPAALDHLPVYRGFLESRTGRTALALAASAGLLAAVSALAPFEAGVGHVQTVAIAAAASHGHADVVRALIPAEAGLTLSLRYALLSNGVDALEVVKALLPHEHDVALFGEGPIHWAATSRRPEYVAAVNEFIAHLSGSRAHAAVAAGDVAAIARLSTPELRRFVCCVSPLMFAVHLGSIPVARALIPSSLGLVSSSERDNAAMALDYAVRRLAEEKRCKESGPNVAAITSLLSDIAAVEAPLQIPPETDPAGFGQPTLEFGAAPPECLDAYDLRRSDQPTALMLAAELGAVEAFPFLRCQLGHHFEGRTALHYAAKAAQLDACKLLLAEAGHLDDNGDYATFSAIEADNVPLVQFLLPIEAALDPNLPDMIGLRANSSAMLRAIAAASGVQ
jgi:ankyrin repeat protein